MASGKELKADGTDGAGPRELLAASTALWKSCRITLAARRTCLGVPGAACRRGSAWIMGAMLSR
jgi:hypothetical protein